MYALCESTLSGAIQAEAMPFRRSFSKLYTHSNIQLNKVSALWKYSEWWASSSNNGFRKKFLKTLYTFKHTFELCMRPVEVHWVVGFKQKQWLSEHFFQNNINIQTYNWTIMRSVKVQCVLGFKHKQWLSEEVIKTYKKNMRSLKVHWVVGFKQKQWFSEEVFQNFLHIQTNNWTMYALCESTLSSGLQAEVMAFRRSFSKHYTNSNMQSNKVCALWKYTEWWASSRSNGFQRKFSNHYTHSNIQLNKVCALRKYIEKWASSRSNGLQKKFFKSLYTFKQTIEQGMRSVKVQWVVGFK